MKDLDIEKTKKNVFKIACLIKMENQTKVIVGSSLSVILAISICALVWVATNPPSNSVSY